MVIVNIQNSHYSPNSTTAVNLIARSPLHKYMQQVNTHDNLLYAFLCFEIIRRYKHINMCAQGTVCLDIHNINSNYPIITNVSITLLHYMYICYEAENARNIIVLAIDSRELSIFYIAISSSFYNICNAYTWSYCWNQG